MKFETYGVMIFDPRYVPDGELTDETYATPSAAKYAAKRRWDGWPASERPSDAKIIAVRITEI